MPPKKQKSVSRGSTPMSMSENHQGFYSKWPRLQREVHFSQLSLLPFYFTASFCSLLDIRTMFISKFGGVYFLLVYHVTPHMLQMTTLRMKFSGVFLDNDFV